MEVDMKSKTFEDRLRELEAKHSGIPADADLRLMAALLRADPPARPSTRKQFEQMRKQILDNPTLMEELRERGLLD